MTRAVNAQHIFVWVSTLSQLFEYGVGKYAHSVTQNTIMQNAPFAYHGNELAFIFTKCGSSVLWNVCNILILYTS